MQSVIYDYLVSNFTYDKTTGLFTRIRTSGGNTPGTVAGSLNQSGYVLISIKSRLYSAHRLAWLYMTGVWPVWPAVQIDHINGIKHDNRFVNLRLASPAQNSANQNVRRGNTVGFKGVTYSKRAKVYIARLSINGKRLVVGRHAWASVAARAYDAAAVEAFGPFAVTNASLGLL